jgi:hypothetical protein
VSNGGKVEENHGCQDLHAQTVKKVRLVQWKMPLQVVDESAERTSGSHKGVKVVLDLP